MGMSDKKESKKDKVEKKKHKKSEEKKVTAKKTEVNSSDVKKQETKKTVEKKNKKDYIVAKLAGKFSRKIIVYTFALLLTIVVCKYTYDFGKLIFKDEGMAKDGQGKEVVVTIPVRSTVQDIAGILKEKGLIESEVAFVIQTYLYEADILSGTYTLNTEYSPEEIIEAMCPGDDE